MGYHFEPYFMYLLHKRSAFWHWENENGTYGNILEKLSSVTLFPIVTYTFVPNVGTLSQTMPWEWSYVARLAWNPYMFIDGRPLCGDFLGEVWQISSLIFLVATSTHKRTPCRRICFFDFFFILFEFFQKKVKMESKDIRSKKLNFWKLSKFMWNNQYFFTLKWFLEKFRSKLWSTCCSNFN